MEKLIIMILSIALSFNVGYIPAVKAAQQDSEIQELVVNPDYSNEVGVETIVKDIQASKTKQLVKSSDVYTSQTELVNFVRNQMKMRKESFSVKFNVNKMANFNNDVSEYFTTLMDLVLQEVEGDPYAGDYIDRHLKGYSMNGNYSVNTAGEFIVTYNFSVAYLSTYNQELEVQNYINKKVSELGLTGTKSKLEKLKAIYDCVRANNTYDYDAANASFEQEENYEYAYTAYGAACVGRSVCQGYASLIYAFCKKASIPVRFVYSDTHGWNIVSLDGGRTFYNIDATWDDTWDDLDRHSYYLKNDSDVQRGNTDHNKNSYFKTESFMSAYPMAEYSYYIYEISSDKHIGRNPYDNAVEIEENHIYSNGSNCCKKCGYVNNVVATSAVSTTTIATTTGSVESKTIPATTNATISTTKENTTTEKNNNSDNQKTTTRSVEVKTTEQNNGINYSNNTSKNDEKGVNVEKSKARISKAKRISKTKIKVSLKKIKGVAKYQILVSKTKSFASKKIILNKIVNKSTTILKSKKFKKKVFMKVRAYYFSAGKKYFGKWSKIKIIKA